MGGLSSSCPPYRAIQKKESIIGGFLQSVRTYGKTRQWNEEDN